MHDHSRFSVCGGLFGCGEDTGRRYMVEPDAVDAALPSRSRDRLQHMDEIDQEALDPYLATYRVSRRRLFGLGGLVSMLAAVTPASLLAAFQTRIAAAATSPSRTHVVESTQETVRLGVLDLTLPNVVEIDSGDTVVYPNTWTHFLNRMQPGVSVQQLAQWRLENPGRGPHSISDRSASAARSAEICSASGLRSSPP